jgi:hypothetical protein
MVRIATFSNKLLPDAILEVEPLKPISIAFVRNILARSARQAAKCRQKICFPATPVGPSLNALEIFWYTGAGSSCRCVDFGTGATTWSNELL